MEREKLSTRVRYLTENLVEWMKHKDRLVKYFACRSVVPRAYFYESLHVLSVDVGTYRTRNICI